MEHHHGLTYGDAEFPLRGTGFVPCPKCSATYTDEELLAYIEANRFCPVPFPDAETVDWDTNTHVQDFIVTLATKGIEIGRTAPIRNAESPA